MRQTKRNLKHVFTTLTQQPFDMYDHYDALIFDMDGTLIDSGALHEHAWTTALNQFDIPISHELMRSLAGVPTRQTVEIIAKHNNLKLSNPIDDVVLAKETFVNTHKFNYIKATPLGDVVRKYHKKKPMAVGTGATKAEAVEMLEACRLISFFDCIVGADDVEHHKPAPDTFLLGAEKMQVDATRCLVFEDSQLGIEAAISAKMEYIDVQKELGIINSYFI